MSDSVKPGARLATIYRIALLPIMVFAPINAVLCWTARDRYEFMATFVGFGCGPIVVAPCAYLFVLVSTVGASPRS